MKQLLVLNFLDFIAADGETLTTTSQLAVVFGKRHDHVLQAIRNLIADLDALETDGDSKEHARNFGEMLVDVKVGNGVMRTATAYRITRDGLTLLAMGFTGKKALAFKVAYIKAFNAMAAYIRNQREGLQYRASDTPDTSEKSAGYQPEPSIRAGCTPDASDTSLFDDTEASNDPAPDPDRWCWPHSEAMNTAEIDTFTVRLIHFTSRGATAAEALADRLVQRDRDADDRHLCLECRHCRHGLLHFEETPYIDPRNGQTYRPHKASVKPEVSASAAQQFGDNRVRATCSQCICLAKAGR